MSILVPTYGQLEVLNFLKKYQTKYSTHISLNSFLCYAKAVNANIQRNIRLDIE